MRKVIITRTVDSTAMTLGEYNKYRGWTIPENEDPNQLGFLIGDENGSVTWMNKELYDKCAKEAVIFDANSELTFGQKAVGLRFNPSGMNSVDECKKKFADLIDDMHNFRNNGNMTLSQEAKRHASVAITELEAAQMRAVKALTWTN